MRTSRPYFLNVPLSTPTHIGPSVSFWPAWAMRIGVGVCAWLTTGSAKANATPNLSGFIKRGASIDLFSPRRHEVHEGSGTQKRFFQTSRSSCLGGELDLVK